jgi:hypothetical protein
VEKAGRDWATEEAIAEEVKAEEGVNRDVDGFVGENMGNGSTGLARE